MPEVVKKPRVSKVTAGGAISYDAKSVLESDAAQRHLRSLKGHMPSPVNIAAIAARKAYYDDRDEYVGIVLAPTERDALVAIAIAAKSIIGNGGCVGVRGQFVKGTAIEVEDGKWFALAAAVRGIVDKPEEVKP